MEDLPRNKEQKWSSENSIELSFKRPGQEDEGTVLHLTWDNTVVYKYRVGNGTYDHIEHHSDDGESYQFFLDDEGLREKLEKYEYPYYVSPEVEQDLVDAREKVNEELRINSEAEQFAARLHQITGPQDFLGLLDS